MKAIQIHEYGGPDVLVYEDAAPPDMQANDVLIRIAAVSFNPIDAKIRAGFMKDHLPRALPFIPGWDCAGVVAKIGGDVSRFKVGDEVFTMAEFGRGGTYAEFVAVSEEQVAHKPKTLSLVAAAALPMTALTALTAIKSADLKSGQTILIHGGAGGVGTMAIQMAKVLGAKVITTASGNRIDLVKSLGADDVIDYKATKFSEVVREVDVVLDLLGGQTQDDSWGVLVKGGMLIATAQPPAQEKAKEFGVRAQFINTQPSGIALEQIAAMVDGDQLRPVVGAEITLANAHLAHEGKSSMGKTVLRVESF